MMEHLKMQIKDYWTRRAGSFLDQRMREFQSEKRKRWMREFHRYLPRDKKLRILDIGTGAGFFACMLAEGGHEVTGIDISEEMIRCARSFAEMTGARADFFVMDAESPSFPPGSFDVIATRNLTWTLPHLAESYGAWARLLAPGGILVNFDADYCGEMAGGEDDVLPSDHAHKSIAADFIAENEEITMELSAYQKRRPEWDVRLLLDAGFERVAVDAGVWERIYAETDEFFNPTPIFTIVAGKGGAVA